MDVFSLAACGVCVLVLLYVSCPRRPTNFPPGPRWLPLVGSLPQLRRLSRRLGHMHLALLKLSELHDSPVVGLKLGGRAVVCVGSWDLVKRVLTGDEFAGRPDSFFSRLRSMGTRRGITFTDGPLWREQRHFVSRQLRQLGLGKRPMERAVLEELAQLTAALGAEQGPVSLAPHLSTAVLNVLLTLVAGARFSHGDPRLLGVLALMERRARCLDAAGGVLSHAPWLRHFLPGLTGYSLLLQLNAELSRVLTDIIDAHKLTYNQDETRDLIDAFIGEMRKNGDTPSTFTEDQLLMVCVDLFIAGSQTTSSQLGFALQQILLRPEVQARVHAELDGVLGADEAPRLEHQDRCALVLVLVRVLVRVFVRVLVRVLLRPEVQARVHAELDGVLGADEAPRLEHQDRLPYTCAVLLEVQRMYPVVPVSGPRRVLKDTKLLNYDIPKDTTVLLNLWPVHMDEGHWGDPRSFRPERFLDRSGAVAADSWLLTFGLGKRRCLGEALARSCLFTFFAGILQRYQLLRAPGQQLPRDEPRPGLTMSPQPYSVLLRPRQPTTHCH
ncbi:methyl farnesoate epoxidase-like [Bacillus rossius redtenbacheri]|uniref:methyl farnesoate epoxidase-like n=1 Tax=Bacillus rossius redtenbacheri TaxID=93214 RepID=UPI002FDDCB51